jgi:hypothetical protein
MMAWALLRNAVQRQVIEGLLAQIDQLEEGGLELGEEDPMPLPDHPPPAVTLSDLRRAVLDELDLRLECPGRPVTFEPRLVTRDL